MICATCGATTTDEVCACGDSPLLRGRYRLEEVLGEHGAARTFAARGDEGNEVVVKELMLRKTASMKEVELFERESQVLRSLDHPAIPRHLDHFVVERGKTVTFYTVVERVDGETLQAMLDSRRFEQREVAELVVDLLAALRHLAAQSPVVVHRDIKPSNILVGADGVRLVGFGAARVVAETLHTAGSTMAGTYGYMAPEQLFGAAGPASDLYSVGATAVALLTRTSPDELLDDSRRIRWRHAASLSREMADAIDSMLALDPAERPKNLEALARRFEASADAPIVAAGSTALTVARVSPTFKAVTHRALEGGTIWGAPALAAVLALAGIVGMTTDPLGMALFFLVPVGLLVYGFWRYQKVQRQWQLIRSTSPVPALLKDRQANANFHVVDFEFEHEGERKVVSNRVDLELYSVATPGTEAVVWVDAEDPERSIFWLLEDD